MCRWVGVWVGGTYLFESPFFVATTQEETEASVVPAHWGETCGWVGG